MIRRTLALTVLLVAACGAPSTIGLAPTPALPSGISGTVVLGPTCPLESEPGAYDPVPCLTPYSAQLVILDGDNLLVARVNSAADGSFRLDLPPGEYVITPQNGDPLPVAQPINVTVTAGEYATVQVNYDSGIR